MRDTFINTLTELAENDPSIYLITGDLGFGVFDDFAERFPKQFLNAGVAEQNMTGLAAGLALDGRKVFTYSIANFATLRCLEQIRNDCCYHDANVTVVASGGGFTYGALGMSHHATEDLGIMRCLPGVNVVAPGDEWETGEAVKALAAGPGVGYLRIEKASAGYTQKDGEEYKIGLSRRVREGSDYTIFAIGGILKDALEAAEKLAESGVQCRVVSCHSLKPFDKAEVIAAAKETGGIITIEEHNKIGGLGSAVAEVLVDGLAQPSRFKRIGLDDCYTAIVGSQEYLREKYRICADEIVCTVNDWQESK